MNENNGTKRREWVKNAIIIFLVIMLLLTFFSNTIMNWSLPEVSAQYARGGTLSEQIRGSGTVQASQSYEVKIGESRKIASVEVKVGDVIEKDAVLYTLEDSESTETEEVRKSLLTEEQSLDDMQLEYNKALLSSGNDYTKENLAIKNKEEDIALAKKDMKKIGTYQKEYENARLVTKDRQSTVDDLTEQVSAFEAKEYASLGSSYYNRIKSAQQSLESAEKAKTKNEENIKEYESNIASGGNEEAITAARQAVENKQLEISQTTFEMFKETDVDKYDEFQKTLDRLNLELNHLQQAYNDALSKSSTYSFNKQRLDAEKNSLKLNQNSYDRAAKKLDDILAEVKKELNDKLKAAQALLDEAKYNEEELSKKANKTVDEAEKEIRAMERDLENAKIDLEEQQRKDAQAAGESALDLKAKQDKINDQKKKISELKEKIKKLEEKSIGAKITAPVAGKVTGLSVVAGEEAAQGTTVAAIEMSEKGYTLEMTVTAEQARKVKIGDAADIQYFWNGNAEAVLQSIQPDKTNPAKNKVLNFTVTGDVTAGQKLDLVMGSKGQNYETLIPNSAIREDNNGKFVLTVVAKSTPLGNRYMAERVDIDILASDDTTSAISGALYGSEFVITASTKPINPGDQVRLVDN